jgi:hypothetical protein
MEKKNLNKLSYSATKLIHTKNLNPHLGFCFDLHFCHIMGGHPQYYIVFDTLSYENN